jgi:hypothetical protein
LDLIQPIKILERIVSKDPEMGKRCAAGKMKHVTLTAPQKLEKIRMFESGKSCSVFTASYSNGLSTAGKSYFTQAGLVLCAIASM